MDFFVGAWLREAAIAETAIVMVGESLLPSVAPVEVEKFCGEKRGLGGGATAK